MKAFWKCHKSKIELILGLALVVAIMYLSGIGCPIKYITGISCAGCGMSRACVSVLHGEFAQAFHYHPLVYLMPFVLVYFFIRGKIRKPIDKFIIFTICIAFAIVYVYRLVNADDYIVTFAPKNGLIWKLVARFIYS